MQNHINIYANDWLEDEAHVLSQINAIEQKDEIIDVVERKLNMLNQ